MAAGDAASRAGGKGARPSRAGGKGARARRRRRREAMKKAAARNKAAASAAVPREQPLSLLMDTGAMTHVAERGWGTLPGNVSAEGFNVRGVGGGVARSTGAGSLTTTFKSGREGL